MENRKIRILFTIPNFRTAGSQFVVRSLISKLDKTKYNPFICVENGLELIPQVVTKQNRLLFNWTGNKLRDTIHFRKFLQHHNIDILHSWDYKSNYLEALGARLAKVKYLYTKKNNAWSYRWMLKSMLSSHIAYDNPEMERKFFASSCFKDKLSFIAHGVDLEVFYPENEVNHKTFNVVCVGNIAANKNQLFLLKALKDLPQDIVVHLVGKEDASYKVLLDNFISAHNLSHRVVFHGFVENRKVPKVLNMMDVFVLASLQEGLPVSLLEAMACGLPALSSDSGGGARYILSPKHIFSLENTEELKRGIRSIYDLNKEERMVLKQQQLQTIHSKFSIEKEIEAYENLYKNLIQR